MKNPLRMFSTGPDTTLATIPRAHGWRRWCMLPGVLLVADTVYLSTVKVTHTGTLVVLLMGLAMLVWGGLSPTQVQRWVQTLASRTWAGRLWRSALALAGCWLVSVLACFWLISHHNRAVPANMPAQWMVVLGSSTPRQQPSPALRARLDKAAQLAQQFPQMRIVVSGGVDFRETVSEAAVMAQYLQRAGVAAERLVQENRSTSTHENLLFSGRIVQSSARSNEALPSTAQLPAVLVVTNDFHTVRARAIAHQTGWDTVYMAGADTPLYMRHAAWLREYFALWSGLLLGEFSGPVLVRSLLGAGMPQSNHENAVQEGGL